MADCSSKKWWRYLPWFTTGVFVLPGLLYLHAQRIWEYLFSHASVPMRVVSVLVPIGMILAAKSAIRPENENKDRTATEMYRCVVLSVWFISGAVCMGTVAMQDPSLQEQYYHAENNLKAFFTRNQITILALVMALAAYISGVEQKLREAIGKATLDKKRKRHAENLQWLLKADVILVFTALTMMIRAGAWAFGSQDVTLDKTLIGLLAWVILYLTILHAVQIFRKPIDQETSQDPSAGASINKDSVNTIVSLIRTAHEEETVRILREVEAEVRAQLSKREA